MKDRIEKWFANWPKLKKIIGVILIFYGFLALLTPFTPGSWLVFIGLEILGFDLIYWKRFKVWFLKVYNKYMNKVDGAETKVANEVAIFGGGCFWCTEAVFKILRGVSSVLPGYSGGKIENPTYEQVSGGKTGHAEVIKIEFDPTQIRYRDLLTVFFGSHDPTTRNQQGNDVGTQYRSVIFYTTEEQKNVARDFIADINTSNEKGAPVVTELVPFVKFYDAENYHYDYFATHPGNPYCEVVINPKLKKVQKEFARFLSDAYKK